MNDWRQYTLVLTACLAITAPLVMFGSGVYRRPRALPAYSAVSTRFGGVRRP
jgi:hypothetical protein